MPSTSVHIDAEGHSKPSTADHDDLKRHTILTKNWTAEMGRTVRHDPSLGSARRFSPGQVRPTVISKAFGRGFRAAECQRGGL